MPTTTKERILEAAYRLFTERSIELTTTREIAAEAQCNEITLFRHFKNKDGLVKAVIEWYVPQQETPRINEIATDDFEADLLALTHLMMEFHKERETFFKFIFANLVQHPENSEFILSIQQPFLEQLYGLFEPHLAESGLDTETVVHDFITPIAMRTVGRIFLNKEQLDEDVFARTHASLIAGGVLTAKTARRKKK